MYGMYGNFIKCFENLKRRLIGTGYCRSQMNTKMNLYNTALLAQLQGVSKNMGIQ